MGDTLWNRCDVRLHLVDDEGGRAPDLVVEGAGPAVVLLGVPIDRSGSHAPWRPPSPPGAGHARRPVPGTPGPRRGPPGSTWAAGTRSRRARRSWPSRCRSRGRPGPGGRTSRRHRRRGGRRWRRRSPRGAPPGRRRGTRAHRARQWSQSSLRSARMMLTPSAFHRPRTTGKELYIFRRIMHNTAWPRWQSAKHGRSWPRRSRPPTPRRSSSSGTANRLRCSSSPERYEELLQALEDGEDVEAFDAAMAEDGANIPWEQVKADLGWTCSPYRVEVRPAAGAGAAQARPDVVPAFGEPSLFSRKTTAACGPGPSGPAGLPGPGG